MKKLLGFLGAIGLVATSSATVVACGPDTTDSRNDLEKLVTITDLGYFQVSAAGTGVSGADLLAKVKELNPISDSLTQEISDSLTVSGKKDNDGVGTAHIMSSLEAYKDMKVNIKYTYGTDAPEVEVKSISNVTVDATADESKTEFEEAVLEAIKEVQPTATTSNFVITYGTGNDALNNDKLVAEKTITIAAAENDTLLKDSFEVTVAAAESKAVDLSTIITEKSLELAKGTDLADQTAVGNAVSAALTAKYTSLQSDKISVEVSKGSDDDANNYVNATITSKDEAVYTTTDGGLKLTLTVAQ